MAETQATTNAVQRLLPLRTVAILNESSTFPYSVVAESVVAMSIYNFSVSDFVDLTITLEDESEFVITIPANVPYNAEFESAITTIDVSGIAPNFNLELMRRRY